MVGPGQPDPIPSARTIDLLLERRYGAVEPFLRFENAFQLLVGVVLSAQSTDAQVNKILPNLFSRWPTPCDWAKARLEDLEQAVFSTGFYRMKARNLRKTAQALCSQGGEVPKEMEELLRLPGVGRKSAHVLRGALWAYPAVIVDTHFARVVRRLGLARATTPERIEAEIFDLIPPERTYGFSMRVNLHGRLVCRARKPDCETCLLRDLCPSRGLFTKGQN